MSADTAAGTSRREQIIKAVQAETGIDEPMVERLVRRFYEQVREDDVIGPVFAERIQDWEPHLRRMCDFWSSVTLMSGRYRGQPMRVHLALPVGGRHFDRWLALFESTARNECPPNAAEYFIERARRIAQSLEFGIGAARGVLLGAGDRLQWQGDAGAGTSTPLAVR